MVEHPDGVWEQSSVCIVMFNIELGVICLFNVKNHLIDYMLMAKLIGLGGAFKVVPAFVSVYVFMVSVLPS